MSVVPLIIPMSAKRAEQTIRALAENPSKVTFGDHALERMEERDISLSDVLNVLCKGFIEGVPVAASKPDEWKCKMTRHSRGNREIGVITIIIRSERLFIKTVEWEDL